MKAIFFNIAWMANYDGVTTVDQPKDGGTWDGKHEVCNFATVHGRCYGFVYQTNMGAIDIERIGASRDAEKIDDVTIIWTAKHENFGTVLVGWYKSATLYRNIQHVTDSELHRQNNVGQFYAECASENAILLPVNKRTFPIPRGKDGMGQHLIWYADTDVGSQTKEKIAKFIAGFGEDKALQAKQISRLGNGIHSICEFDPELDDLAKDLVQIESSDESPSEVIRLINARVGQGEFRKFLDILWNNSCTVTGCSVRQVLRASHIKPWRECANKRERLDPDNGILLSAHLDALFDEGLISFDDNGTMLVRDGISHIDRTKLGLPGKLNKRLTDGQKRYLAFHRSRYFN